jgi:hypothetical protein
MAVIDLLSIFIFEKAQHSRQEYLGYNPVNPKSMHSTKAFFVLQRRYPCDLALVAVGLCDGADDWCLSAGGQAAARGGGRR